MAPPKRPWFRFYVEAVADKKLRRAKPETRWLFVACLAAARQSSLPGFLMVSERVAMNSADLADCAGLTRRQVTDGMAALIAVGVMDHDKDLGAWFVPKWNERQYESDVSTERVRRNRDATPMERPNDVEGTSTENRGQKTEEKREVTGSTGHPLLAPGRDPSLSVEMDEIVAALGEQHGPVKIGAAVERLLVDHRRFPWPSDARKALEVILGTPATAGVLDSTGAAQAAMIERNQRAAPACKACEDRGVVELEDGTFDHCTCTLKASA